MYRNCLRLQPSREDLKEALSKAESWADGQRAKADGGGSPGPVVSSEGFDALAIPRGPQRMLPGLEAWCSFCCRPTNEVGELVAGPAGAFICAECVGQSGELLGLEKSAPSKAETPRAVVVELPVAPKLEAPVVRESTSLFARTTVEAALRKPRSWLGPEPVLLAARSAVAGRGPAIVIVGPEGTGKTALLDTLGDERPELARVDLALGDELPKQGSLLVEHLDQASPRVRAELRGRAFVATWRADVEPDALGVTHGETEHAFGVATGFALPPELSTTAALALPLPDEALLHKLCERSIEENDGPILAPAVQEALVKRALASGRGAKGLLAELGLLRSLPPGSSIGLSGAGAKRRRRKRP
ncbi:MAG: hypothetical protein JST54_23615 [Deltaproteobacteria bacterium]|nr:hypothetical protein [Deltaproteobacteria bacterium]